MLILKIPDFNGRSRCLECAAGLDKSFPSINPMISMASEKSYRLSSERDTNGWGGGHKVILEDKFPHRTEPL